MKPSLYLIERGWFPSPTIGEDGGWEHPVLSMIPSSLGEFCELYEPTRRRVWTDAAINIQVFMEGCEESELYRETMRIGNVVDRISEFTLKHLPSRYW